jgi:hypothetical protein
MILNPHPLSGPAIILTFLVRWATCVLKSISPLGVVNTDPDP